MIRRSVLCLPGQGFSCLVFCVSGFGFRADPRNEDPRFVRLLRVSGFSVFGIRV